MSWRIVLQKGHSLLICIWPAQIPRDPIIRPAMRRGEGAIICSVDGNYPALCLLTKLSRWPCSRGVPRAAVPKVANNKRGHVSQMMLTMFSILAPRRTPLQQWRQHSYYMKKRKSKFMTWYLSLFPQNFFTRLLWHISGTYLSLINSTT